MHTHGQISVSLQSTHLAPSKPYEPRCFFAGIELYILHEEESASYMCIIKFKLALLIGYFTQKCVV